MKKIVILIILLFTSQNFIFAAHTVHKVAGYFDCSACHTMHNSQGNAGMGGNPTGKLLRGSNVENLCLSCHDTAGSQYNLYVNIPVVKGNPLGIPASGNFSDLNPANDSPGLANSGNGHNLGEGNNSVTPAGGTTIPANIGFTCTNCHDPHMTASDTATVSAYRGLLHTPKGSTGTAPTKIWAYPVGGCTGCHDSHGGDAYLFGDGVYRMQGIYYGKANNSKSNISQWCGTCHVNFYGSANQGSGSPYLRHPTDKSLGSVIGANYLGIAEAARYPAEDAVTSTNWNKNNTMNRSAGNENNDGVFCLSCHKAHATSNPDAIRWEYEGTGQSSPASGCQQCHNQ